jgi:hypothetical protein
LAEAVTEVARTAAGIEAAERHVAAANARALQADRERQEAMSIAIAAREQVRQLEKTGRERLCGVAVMQTVSQWQHRAYMNAG